MKGRELSLRQSPKLRLDKGEKKSPDEEFVELELPAYRFFPSYRLGMLLMGGVMITILTSIYSTLHFAWVCMVNDTAVMEQSGRNMSGWWESREEGYRGELVWDKSVQQILFSAYNFGIVLASVFPGWVVDRFGVKRAAAGALLLTSLSCLLLPSAAHVHFGWVAVLRILTGLGGSMSWPIIFSVISHWTVRTEVGIGLVFSATGFPLGAFLCMLFSGMECAHLGWPWVFYMSGTVGVFYVLLWMIFFKSDPSTAYKGFKPTAFLTDSERDYILTGRDRAKKKESHVPWRRLFTSLPMLSCMMSNFANWCCVFMVMGFSASFLKEVLRVEVEKNGVLSSLPSGVFAIGRWVNGPISDRVLRNKKTLSVKVFNSICLFSSTLCFTCQAIFVNESSPPALPVFLFSLNMFFASFCTGGYQRSVAQIAPKFSSIGGSLMSTFGAIGVMIEPFLIARLTQDGTSQGWARFFACLAGLTAFAGIFFLIFGSGEIQNWAKEETSIDPKPSTATLLRLEVLPEENGESVMKDTECDTS